MARIPTISGTAVPSSPLGIKADAGAAMAGARANSQFAGALQQTAQVMAGIVAQRQAHIDRGLLAKAQRQAHIDRGLLAKEDNIRSKTAAEVEAYMVANQGTPENWQKFYDEAWKAYDGGRNERAKEWSPQLKEADDLQTEKFRTESGIVFEAKKNVALLKQANARLEANGDMKLMDGDVNGALQSYGAMNLTPDRKLAKIQQATDKAEFNRYATQLSDATDINVPAAKSLDELKRIEAELKAKNKGGEYQYGKIANEKGEIIGGLMEENRIQLLNRLREMKNVKTGQMEQTARGIIAKARANRNVNVDQLFTDAFNQGEITREIGASFLPDYQAIQIERAEAAADKMESRSFALRDRMEKQIKSTSGAPLTVQDIENRMVIGATNIKDPRGLTKEHGLALIQELKATEAADTGESSYKKIANYLDGMMGQMLGVWAYDDAQMSDEKRSEVLANIHAAPISKGAKLQLLDKFLAVQRHDLREDEISDKDGDREISPEEKSLRLDILDIYGENKKLRALSMQAIGAQYMNDLNKISDWYRKNPNATEAQREGARKKFTEEIKRSISDASANSLFSEIYE